MVYSKYGLTFRKIREQKKLSLSIFPKIGISKPALSKFERGETMMGFENVVCALQVMGVTLEEYENFLNDYSISEEESLWEEIEKAAFQDDVQKLKEIQCYAQESGFRFIGLAAKACHSSLELLEAEEITEHLYDIEIWSFSELRLFYFSMESLSKRDVRHVFKNFFPEGHKIFNSKKHRQYLVQVCCRAITLFSTYGFQKEAQTLLEQLEVHTLVRTMFQRNLRNITEGYWKHRFGDPVQGENQVREGLDILRTVSSPEELAYYQRRYGQLIKQ